MFPDGKTRTFDFSLKPALDDKAGVVQVVAEAREVTDLKRTEATLRQSQKLETIGQLTGGVAHDFNNLLMAVIANLDLLGETVSDGNPRGCSPWSTVRMRGGARAGGRRLPATPPRVARRQDLQPQAVDAHEADRRHVQNVCLRQSVGSRRSRIAIREQCPRQTRPGRSTTSSNSRSSTLRSTLAMPCQRVAVLTVGEGSKRLKYARVRTGLLKPGAYLRLGVSDTGVGMDEATLKRAVEPFSLHQRHLGKGTGLGLSMIHGLAGAVRAAACASRAQLAAAPRPNFCCRSPTRKPREAIKWSRLSPQRQAQRQSCWSTTIF